MPMIEATAIAAAISECQAKGFNTTEPGWRGNVMIEAITNAVIAEVRKADVASAGMVTGGGSSSGSSTASDSVSIT